MRYVTKSRKDAELAIMVGFLRDLGRGRARNVEATLSRNRQYARSLRPALEGALAFDRAVRQTRVYAPAFKLTAKLGRLHATTR